MSRLTKILAELATEQKAEEIKVALASIATNCLVYAVRANDENNRAATKTFMAAYLWAIKMLRLAGVGILEDSVPCVMSAVSRTLGGVTENIEAIRHLEAMKRNRNAEITPAIKDIESEIEDELILDMAISLQCLYNSPRIPRQNHNRRS